MTLLELVEECKDRHITFVVRAEDEPADEIYLGRHGDLRLLYRDPMGMMTEDFFKELRAHKQAILDIVVQQQVVTHA